MSPEQEWHHWVALHVADALLVGMLIGLIVWLVILA